jgi:tetratricopeptide (TPR) repeat protein
LSQERQLEQLHSTMRRNYAAALQDDAQQVINRLLKSNPDEYERSGYYISRNYKNYPKYLKRAAELLGPDHYMYNILKARESWFKGYIDRRKIKCNCPNQKVGKKSISLYKKALRLQPNMPTAYWEMAAAFANQLLQPDSAEHYAEKALEQNPNWTMIHAEMAHFYVDKNKFKKAHEWIDRGLAIDATSITLLYELTWIYNKQLDYEKEVAVLDQILTRDTFASTLAFKGDALRKMGQFAESEQVLLEALARDSLHTNANDWLLNLYTFTSQFDKEEAHLEKMLRRFPKDDWYKSRLVRFRAYRGDYEGAVAASAHNRKNTPNYRAVGRNFQRYGNRELAEKAFTKCIETYPKSVAKHVEIGIGYTREEEWETALVYLLVACGLDSTNYYAHNQTAQAFVGAKQYDDALEYFDKALTINPDAHLVLLHKGAVQMHLKDYDAAEATLKKAEKLNSKWNSLKYATLGLLFYLTDRSEQAESTVKKAFKTLRDRDLRDIFIHTARYFSMFEKYEEGEQALLFLYKIAGPNEFADFELAQLMAKGGDYDKAYRYLRSAIDNYYSDFYQIRGTKYFRPMMEDKKRWHREMGAYFPDLSK